MDLINYPIVTNANTVKMFFINQLLVSERARVIRKLIDRFSDLFSCLFIESAKCFGGRLLEFNFVCHKPSSALRSSQEIDSSFRARLAARISDMSSGVSFGESTLTPDESRNSTSCETFSLST